MGDRFRPTKKRTPLSTVLKEQSPFSSHHLRKRLIQEGFKEAKCEVCGLTAWNGKDIPLELNHINGINDDNRIENLEIICPNCHAQTEHYRGRSKKVSATNKKREIKNKELMKTLVNNNKDGFKSKEGGQFTK